MLVLPKPTGFSDEAWEKAELDAMKEVVGLYGKTWHFWQIDLGHEIPLGGFTFSVVGDRANKCFVKKGIRN